jgi:hypothetical protein
MKPCAWMNRFRLGRREIYLQNRCEGTEEVGQL